MDWRALLWLIGPSLACGIALPTVSAASTDSCTSNRSDDLSKLKDFVTVGISDHKLILATPEDECGWRYRILVLPASDPGIEDATLATMGAKVAVLLADDSHYIYDLTSPGPPLVTATLHLPAQSYELCRPDTSLVLLGDDNEVLGDSLTNRCPHSQPADIVQHLDRLPELKRSLDALQNSFNVRNWKYSNLVADQHLYAPVLEFAKEEKVFPSSTTIWVPLVRDPESHLQWDLKPGGAKFRERLLLRKYLSSSLRSEDPTVYYRIENFRGSWLFEYWTYYVFDVGGVGPHAHDTEHVFVEVDKLGGRIVSVLAQAHTDVAPNNLYSALIPASEPSSLPIFVFVERGKHAIAPDINHDRTFTPGIDVNVFSEESHIWGVRDAIGQSDAHISSSSSSMTLSRDLGNAWAEESFDRYFGNNAPHPTGSRYRLLLLGAPHRPNPESSPCHLEKLSKDCAIYDLETHADARHPKHIYKKWAFPFQEVRVGFANIEGGSSFSIGYVHDVSHLPGFKKASGVPIPGRIAFEVFAFPFAVPTGPQSSDIFALTSTRQGLRLQYGLQYEKSISNLFGYFGGYFRREFFISSCPTANCFLTDPLPGNLYQFGMYLEIPTATTNVTLHLGPVFSTPGSTAGVYFRISFGIWSRRGRTTFGNPRFADDRKSRP